ncbi:MAG: hypothetical protein A4E62_01248 [Syntrophorhabdus sp. PtaU1.Bin002]|nr:MAG: hypothetical protein A4E62_01248 [Syntrophorhabdus sp. PtaU1.Bin002]
MKGLKFLMTAILLMPLLAYGAGPGDVNLRFIKGDVQMKTEDTQDWVPAAINVPLFEKDMLWVPEDGKAELQLAGGSVVRLGGGTLMEVDSLNENGFECYLGEGHAYVNARGPKGYLVAVSTPGGPFRGYPQSVFRVDVDRDGNVEASALTGALYAKTDNDEMKINAGERLVSERNQGELKLIQLASSDSWERWNRGRDRELFGSGYGNRGSRYLPEELIPYSNDLDGNGRWVQTSEYGYVWTPTTIAENDWAPYRMGRWVWARGDYVWVSHERWGWAPYHYGRWAHIRPLGWCWVPPRHGSAYWSPGYVAWVHTPRYVAWTPLAPHETYYGRGNFGPNSVNITNVNVNKTVINNVNTYKNIYVQNGVTTIDHDSFIHGKQRRMHTNDNLFLKERKVMPAPAIQPGKAIVVPVIKNIPSAKLPPQKVRNVKPGELNRRYPVHRGPIKLAQPGPVLPDTPPKKGPAQNRSGEPNKNRITSRSPSGVVPSGREAAPPIIIQNDRGPAKQNLPDTSVRPHAQPAQPKVVQPVVMPPNPQGPGVGQPKRETKPVVQPRSIPTGPPETRPAVRNTPSVPIQPSPPIVQQKNDRGPAKQNLPSDKPNETIPVIKNSQPVLPSPAVNPKQQQDGGNRRILETRPTNEQKGSNAMQGRTPGNVTVRHN